MLEVIQCFNACYFSDVEMHTVSPFSSSGAKALPSQHPIGKSQGMGLRVTERPNLHDTHLIIRSVSPWGYGLKVTERPNHNHQEQKYYHLSIRLLSPRGWGLRVTGHYHLSIRLLSPKGWRLRVTGHYHLSIRLVRPRGWG